MTVLPGAVLRAVRRDDLLQLASEADVAVGIVRQREHLLRDEEREAGVFSVALSHYLAETRSPEWAIRSQACSYAASLLSFCRHIAEPLGGDDEPAELFARAAAELKSDVPWEAALDHDLALSVFNTYRRARHLRMNGEYETALELVSVPLSSLFNTGAEPHWGLYMYEYAMCLMLSGRAAEVPGLLDGKCAEWEAEGQPECVTRHRLDFAIALAHWAVGEYEQARQRFADARDGFRRVTRARTSTGGREYTRIRLNVESVEIYHLSLVQSLAECSAMTASSEVEAFAARDLGCLALEITERIRGRWRVIARSQTPLSTVFRRIFGDIALLANDLPGGTGAELGLQAALSAKQTGFAARIRQQSLLMSPQLRSLLEEVAEIEDPPVESLVATTGESTEERLRRVNGWIAQTTSTMLAETVLPEPAAIAEIRERVGDRWAVDYVALPNTLSEHRDDWFRAVLPPVGGPAEFERFRPGPAFHAFFTGANDQPAVGSGEPWVDRLPEMTAQDGPDWRTLAHELLPDTITRTLLAATGPAPVELLISAHAELSLLPWAALCIDDLGTRLIERAVLTQCPVLTCLDSTAPPTVESPALVCLAPDLRFLAAERTAWQLGPGSPVLQRCDWPDGRATAVDVDLVSVLRDRAFDGGLLHIACHGDGTGLEQRLFLPPRPLPAAQALSLEWPPSVLMASCRVGRLHNPDDAEPLSLVMAMLTGGARCVVAAIDEISDAWASRNTANMINAIRRRPTRLDLELRDLQLGSLNSSRLDWALLSAYVR